MEPQGSTREGSEAQEATPSGFGIPLATLPEASSTEARPLTMETAPSARTEAMPQPEELVEVQVAPSPADWQGEVLSVEDVRESLDKTLSPGTPRGEQEESSEGLNVTETPSGDQQYHTFSEPSISTEEGQSRVGELSPDPERSQQELSQAQTPAST